MRILRPAVFKLSLNRSSVSYRISKYTWVGFIQPLVPSGLETLRPFIPGRVSTILISRDPGLFGALACERFTYTHFVGRLFLPTPDAFDLADIYTSRADTYLKAGQYKNAAEDYARSTTLDPSSSTNTLESDRWKDIGIDSGVTYSIDALTLDFSKADPNLWLKSTYADGSYAVQNYEFDCTNRQIKSLSATSYDTLGNVSNTTGEQDWQSIAPQTIGETLYDGMCPQGTTAS
ncbi:MAG TPA: tetratricopeptide repeat protein [Candidatus Paceibacterota bacterium]|jgi:hypothetical protein|nr:tetratricopeptide repeat protein [Candidatus Paceibacterota bacterium]